MKMKFTLFFLAFALCTSFTTLHAQVNVKDSLALVDLYNSTDGPHWSRHDNWLTKNSVSTWFGILISNSRVVNITLSGDNLTGSLSTSIGNIVNLTYLDLSNNQLSGSIPTSIGNLVNLSALDLYDNQLSGSIPTSIGNLVNLTDLRAWNNQLSSSIPSSLGNLVKLWRLNLDNNQLSGSMSSSLGNLKSLQLLSIRDNELTDSIPSSLGNLTTLQFLILSKNRFTGSIPPSLGNLNVNLRYLSLDSNQLTGNIPASLGNLALNSLDLNNNKLTGGIPSLHIGGGLSLSHNQLSGTIPSSLQNLTNLRYLHLEYNQFSGGIPSFLGNLVNLYYLDLSHNHLGDSIPSSIGKLVNLHYLLLNNNRLGGRIPSSFSNLLHGLRLNLKQNKFTFDGMELVAQTFPYAVYDNQQLIPVRKNGNSLSVSVGGTLSNNTYTWFIKLAQTKDTVVIKGDSVFHPTKSGTYRVKVTNSIATQLKLQSDTIVYMAPALAASSINSLQQQTHAFSVYPNPAKNVLYVQTNSNASFSLLDPSGKILLTTSNINGKGSINISGIGAGVYYLRNNTAEAVQKVIIAK